MDLISQNQDPDDTDNQSSEDEEEEEKNGNNPIICDLCGTSYKTECAYQTHQKQKHKIKYVSVRNSVANSRFNTILLKTYVFNLFFLKALIVFLLA